MHLSVLRDASAELLISDINQYLSSPKKSYQIIDGRAKKKVFTLYFMDSKPEISKYKIRICKIQIYNQSKKNTIKVILRFIFP